MVEVKNVIGYIGLYLIDSLGNVVSLPKIQGRRLHNKYKILNTKVNKFGYKEVALTKNGKTKTLLLHRLIAQHFVPNPNDLPCVNHKNGVKADNRIENLEWCTKSQNTKHAFDNNLGGFKLRAIKNLESWNRCHAYLRIVLEKDGRTIEFSSTFDAARFIGARQSDITRAITKRQCCHGYRVFGFKLQDFANGETSQRQSRGKPEKSGTCIDYSSEGK